MRAPMPNFLVPTSAASAAALNTAVTQALRLLESAETVQEVLDYRSQAEALRVLAERARFGLQAANAYAELRLRSERRLGELLRTIQRQPPGRPQMVSPCDRLPTLRSLGISKSMSSRAQRLADIPLGDFNRYIGSAQDAAEEITFDRLTFSVRRMAQRRHRERVLREGRITDLSELQGEQFGTIYIDPPWTREGSRPPYPTMTLDEIASLPVGALAAPRCHCHVWCQPGESYIAAREIVHRWGFRPVAELVWIKPTLGRGQFWRMSHEVLLSASNQQHDGFEDRSLRSWIEAPAERHSEKPEIVRTMIERASPGPRLELFARRASPGWVAWGNEMRLLEMTRAATETAR